MKDKAGLIPLQNFNKGGLAASKWSGVEDSLYKMTGWDPHSLPGVIQVEQKMTKLGDTIDEFCRVAITCSNGSQYWFSYTSGNIWEVTSAGVVQLVHTTTPAAGNAGCLGAAEYQGTIYWFTQSRVHKITVATADDNNWAGNATEDWATFGITNASYHPHCEQNRVLYIGDGNRVAQIDAGVFSANALDIKAPNVIKSLGKIGTDVLIGTYIADSVTANRLIRWNTWSLDFTSSDDIPEVGINAFLTADNMVLVQAGNQGNIYYYDGANLELYDKIPGSYSSTAYGEVWPYSVANKNGQVLFGFSNGSGNPADQLIYRIGRHSRDFPYIMDAPYPISERSGGDLVITGLEIGAILVVGNIVYAAWKNGATCRVDKLDVDNKLSGAYLESRVTVIHREELANFSEAMIAYASMPEGASVDFYLDKNYGGYSTALAKMTDTDRNLIKSKDASATFTTLQMKIKATTSANNGPLIESGAIVVR